MVWVSDDTASAAVKTAIKKIERSNVGDICDTWQGLGMLVGVALEELLTNPENYRDDHMGFCKPAKNNQHSTKWREEGNKFFAFKDDLLSLEQSLECYTKCIAYATASSRELALGYANRSAVLLKLNRPKECLEDIESALIANYPKESRPKLWIRRAEAYEKLAEHNFSAAKFWLNKTPLREAGRSQMVEMLRNYSETRCDDTAEVAEPAIPELKSPNSKYPYVSSAVDLEFLSFSEKKIVATRDIEIGEVLFIEKPYSRLTGDRYFYTYCTHCLNSFWNGIPCDGCANVLYCSEKCKELSWREYHNFECPILGILLQYDFIPVKRIRPLRLLLQMHYEAGGINNLMKRMRFFTECEESGNTKLLEEWYKELSLETVLVLNSKLDDSPTSLVSFALQIALSNMFYLTTLTDFFHSKFDSEEAPENETLRKMVVGGLLLRLTLTIFTDSFTWNEAVVKGDDVARGDLLMPFSSSTNASCHPNCIIQCLRDSLVILAVLPIMKGEELGMPWELNWYHHAKDQRIAAMREAKTVLCSCIACKNNWPILDNVPDFKVQAKTPQMRSKINVVIRRLPKIVENFEKADDQEKNKVCEDVKRIFKTIYNGVNMPCKEFVTVMLVLRTFYERSSKVPKLKKLHSSEEWTIC